MTKVHLKKGTEATPRSPTVLKGPPPTPEDGHSLPRRQCPACPKLFTTQQLPQHMAKAHPDAIHIGVGPPLSPATSFLPASAPGAALPATPTNDSDPAEDPETTAPADPPDAVPCLVSQQMLTKRGLALHMNTHQKSVPSPPTAAVSATTAPKRRYSCPQCRGRFRLGTASLCNHAMRVCDQCICCLYRMDNSTFGQTPLPTHACPDPRLRQEICESLRVVTSSRAGTRPCQNKTGHSRLTPVP